LFWDDESVWTVNTVIFSPKQDFYVECDISHHFNYIDSFSYSMRMNLKIRRFTIFLALASQNIFRRLYVTTVKKYVPPTQNHRL